MAHILADPPSLVRCLVRAEFLHNLQSHHGLYHPAHILGIRCQPAASLQFQIRFDDPALAGAMFCLPIQALAWKECPMPPPELIQPWDTFSADFTVHEFALWSRGNALLLNTRQCPGYPERLPARYLFTLDFSGNALADDFEQHKQLHLLQVEGGWFAAVPNNRVLSIDEAFAKPCQHLPRLESLAHLMSTECPVGQPALTASARGEGQQPPIVHVNTKDCQSMTDTVAEALGAMVRAATEESAQAPTMP